MTLLHDAVEQKKMDVRMVERNVARGVMGSDEIEKLLKKLPDDGENAEFVSIQTLAEQEDSAQ